MPVHRSIGYDVTFFVYSQINSVMFCVSPSVNFCTAFYPLLMI